MADPEKATKVVKLENGLDDEDIEDEEVSTNAKAAMVAELLKNPALFSMMNADYISSLPAPVKRRLKALKKIQLESTYKGQIIVQWVEFSINRPFVFTFCEILILGSKMAAGPIRGTPFWIEDISRSC